MNSSESPDKPRLLVTGASGLLGWNIVNAATRDGFQVTGVHRRDLPRPALSGATAISADLTIADLHHLLTVSGAEVVLHCAAAANAHEVEHDPEATAPINVDVPRRLSAVAKELSVQFLQISTDLVFDGTSAPYDELAEVAPLSIYGRQKAAAEEWVLRNGGAVCRLPLLLGAADDGPRGALRWLIDSLSGAGAKLFTDEYRSPLAAPTAARGLLRLACQRRDGIWHLAGQRCSRWQLGQEVAKVWGITEPQMIPLKQSDADLPAPRPADVTLSCQRALQAGFTPPTLTDQLREVHSMAGNTTSDKDAK